MFYFSFDIRGTYANLPYRGLRLWKLVSVFLISSIRFILHAKTSFARCLQLLVGSICRFTQICGILTRLGSRKFVSSQTGETMKLYSDRGNLFLLRIVAAKNLAKVPLTIQYITYEGTSKMFSFIVGLRAKLEL